ncbi:hypothetical protein T492DRAFT_840839 [Pavlovales sp. CCMP2436]|nr:hypothetical protein T492DRAFT_840839 [Pavlovales sp. CCMP2436]
MLPALPGAGALTPDQADDMEHDPGKLFPFGQCMPLFASPTEPGRLCAGGLDGDFTEPASSAASPEAASASVADAAAEPGVGMIAATEGEDEGTPAGEGEGECEAEAKGDAIAYAERASIAASLKQMVEQGGQRVQWGSALDCPPAATLTPGRRQSRAAPEAGGGRGGQRHEIVDLAQSGEEGDEEEDALPARGGSAGRRRRKVVHDSESDNEDAAKGALQPPSRTAQPSSSPPGLSLPPTLSNSGFCVDDRVLGDWEGKGKWYPGSVKSFDSAIGIYEILYDDGDEEAGVPPERMRREDEEWDPNAASPAKGRPRRVCAKRAVGKKAKSAAKGKVKGRAAKRSRAGSESEESDDDESEDEESGSEYKEGESDEEQEEALVDSGEEESWEEEEIETPLNMGKRRCGKRRIKMNLLVILFFYFYERERVEGHPRTHTHTHTRTVP